MTIIERTANEVTVERRDGYQAIVSYESVGVGDSGKQERNILAYAAILDDSDWIPQ